MNFISLNEFINDDVNKEFMNDISYSDYSEKKMKNDHDSFEQQIQSEINDNEIEHNFEDDFNIAIAFEIQKNAKIRLNDLNDENKKRLMQKTMKKKFRTHRMKFYHKLKFEENTIQIKFIIKYLHS